MLDNAEGRRLIPVEGATHALRRVWGAADKDEYFLDDKQLTLSQLNNVLDVLGVSRSSPYNIV